MKKNNTHILAVVLKNNGFAKIEETLFQDLNNVVQKETLGHKVATARIQRKQGHFNKAILAISEANRDQVLSIRETQSIIDKIEDRPKTEVIFEKFRQFHPFQIGLTHGEDVLELLAFIKAECNLVFEDLIADLHRNEHVIDPIRAELKFYETRMEGHASEDEINALKKNILKVEIKIFEAKISTINCICKVIKGKYSHISIADKTSLIKNIYQILSSSIQTLDSKFVETEPGT